VFWGRISWEEREKPNIKKEGEVRGENLLASEDERSFETKEVQQKLKERVTPQKNFSHSGHKKRVEDYLRTERSPSLLTVEGCQGLH